jgi:hypothetical protein
MNELLRTPRGGTRARHGGGATKRTGGRVVGALAAGSLAALVLPGPAPAPAAAAAAANAVAATGLAGLTTTPAPLHLGRVVSPGRARPGVAVATQQRVPSVRDIAFSTNWSGLGGTGTGIQGARGTWIVPSVATAVSGRYSSSWVGVDGMTNRDLVQTGTEQDGPHGYYAWWEILPQYSVPIVNAQGQPEPVRPGDKITASVFEASAGVWTISIQDSTQHWSYSQNHAYTGPGTSAEWIEEAPNVNGVQSTPPNFGTAHFAGTEVSETVGGKRAWHSTGMTSANEIAMVKAGGTKIVALPSALSGPSDEGQSFSVRYVQAALAPAGLRVSAKVRSAKVSWRAPTNTGGTPVVSYQVREYRAGVLEHTFTVTSLSATIKSLSAGARYSFSIAAHTAGNYTSAWSTRSATVRPRG